MGMLVAACVLSMAEVCLRLTLGPPPPAVQVYSRSESKGSWLELSNGLVSPTFQGRLGDALRVAFLEGVFAADSPQPRFAVLGGSVVHGGTPNMPSGEEFTALLGQKVAANGINLGNPGLDSHDLVGILEELSVYRMDAWVVYAGHNDFGNGYFLQRYQGWPGGLRAHGRSVLEGFQLFWQIRKLAPRAVSQGAEPNPSSQFAAPEIGPAEKSHILMDYLRNMRRIVWLAGEAEVPLVLVVPAGALLLPPLGQCQEGVAMKLWRQGVAQHADQNPEALNALLEARDADCIPLRMPGEAQDGLRELAHAPHVWRVDAARELPREPGLDIAASSLFVDHVHLSTAGHQALAELIAPTLRAALPSAHPQ